MASLNFKHLRYFWVVAKAGGIARAGRRLELTDAGRVALGYADEILTPSAEPQEVLRHSPGRHGNLRRAVGARRTDRAAVWRGGFGGAASRAPITTLDFGWTR